MDSAVQDTGMPHHWTLRALTTLSLAVGLLQSVFCIYSFLYLTPMSNALCLGWMTVTMLIIIADLLYFTGSLIFARKRRGVSVRPLIGVIFGVGLGVCILVFAGSFLKKVYFGANYDGYMSAVRYVEGGNVRLADLPERIKLPDRFRRLAIVVRAWKNAKGEVFVEFTRGGNLLYQSGYLHISPDDGDAGHPESRMALKRIRDGWYGFTNTRRS